MGDGGGKKRFKVLTVVIRIRAEEMPKQFGIPRRVTRPHIPNLVAQRISYKFIFRPFHDVVRAHIWRLSIWVFRCIELLGRKKAEVLAPEKPTERGCMVPRFKWLAIHGAVQEILIFHNDGEFTVMNAKLRLP